MKKIFLALTVVLSVSTSAFAGNSSNNSAAWNMEINTYKLGRFLDLKGQQYDDVLMISEHFSDELRKVNFVKEEDKAKRLRTAVYGNLKLMKNTLTDAQYKKYVHLVNVTLKNKGLDTYLTIAE